MDCLLSGCKGVMDPRPGGPGVRRCVTVVPAAPGRALHLPRADSEASPPLLTLPAGNGRIFHSATIVHGLSALWPADGLSST